MNRDLRVAMLTYSTRPRGGVVHALKLAEHLVGLGVDATLYSLARKDDRRALKGFFRKVSAPFEIIPYDWHRNLVTRLERMIEAYSLSLPRDFSVYHAQDCVGGTALGRMRTARRIKAPVFRTIHHIDEFADPQLLRFEKRAVGMADHRFVVSRYWKQLLKAEYGCDSTITYNGIDLEDFSDLPKRDGGRPNVLFVGGLEPRKGLEYLLEAMEYVHREVPGTRLVAVAKTGFRGTDDWKWFATLADRLGIADCVEFHESVKQETLLRFYSNCDILALPSKTEGWGLALMEAMACGKPVVASRAGGIPELVRDGIEGILVEPGDVRGLAGALGTLLGDNRLRSRMGRAGVSRVRSFSWDRTARVALREYRKALSIR
ncbi:MAG TPA: MSMEG_0565 family glycosyltransferase [Thermoplasmata archaeon]